MFYHSASCYSRMRKAGLNLPHESTVRRWVSPYSIEPGVSPKIISILTAKFSTMKKEHCLSVVKLDGMGFKKKEAYSKKYDLIEGLVDLGQLGRTNVICKEALLFTLDSINHENPWRQPIAYVFIGDGSGQGLDISSILSIMLPQLKDAGADVKGVVCDQCRININSFFLLGASEKVPYFYLNNVKYSTIFDFPHIIKRFVYHLRTYTHFYKQGKIIVNFNDLLNTWRLDRQSNFSNVYKLDNSYFFPNSFQAMSVQRAFKLFSHTMASGITTAGLTGNLTSDTWKESAHFCEKLNKIIDACNSYYKLSVQKFKRPLSDRNPDILETLKDCLIWASDWYVQYTNDKGEIVKKRPPCFDGLLITINCLINIYQDTKKDYPNFELATGLCNQDSVEHTHSTVRGRGGFNFNPTPRQYRLTFRHMLSMKCLETSDRGNVKCDKAESLISKEIDTRSTETSMQISANASEYSMRNEINNIGSFRRYNEAISENENHEEYESPYLNKIQEALDALPDLSVISEMFLVGKFELNSIAYFAGYIAYHSVDTSKCEKCREKFLKTPMEDFEEHEIYIREKEFDHDDPESPDFGYLCRPSTLFLRVIYVQLQNFFNCAPDLWHERELSAKLIVRAVEVTNEHFTNWFFEEDPCFQHKIEALIFLYTVKIFATCRKHNIQLKASSNKSKNKDRKYDIVSNV